MYCLWKTQGTWLTPWREDLEIGGAMKDSVLYLTISAKEDWSGNVMFDRKRHAEYLHLPVDWPRINQFPEYFSAERGKSYKVASGNRMKEQVVQGEGLLEGLPVKVKAGETVRMIVGRK
jgi:hypothetical protein